MVIAGVPYKVLVLANLVKISGCENNFSMWLEPMILYRLKRHRRVSGKHLTSLRSAPPP